MSIVTKTSKEMEEIVKNLKTKFPGWNITWGYIGNIWRSPYLDDRHWQISMRPQGILTSWEMQDIFNIESKEDKFSFDEEKLLQWIDRQNFRWNDYTSKHLINKLKGETEHDVLVNMLTRHGYEPREVCYLDKTYIYKFRRRTIFGDIDEYVKANVEFAFDDLGNLIDVRASS